MSNSDPITIIFVSSGSRGDRLLFRYPYESEDAKLSTLKGPGTNPYAVRISEDSCVRSALSSINSNTLIGYSEEVLASLLAVKPDQCGRKFEVKVNDVFFIGHPMLLTTRSSQPSPKKDRASLISFNIVFALGANADDYMLACYHSLSHQLAIALQHEEQRCGYLNQQKDSMCAISEDADTRNEDSMESPYFVMLKNCLLAKQLKSIYHNLCGSGVVHVFINKWVQVNFCLPHKVHSRLAPSNDGSKIQPAVIDRCIKSLRPYHGILLLVDEEVLLDSLPPDSSPCLVRLIQMSSPLKNLQNLALDTDLSLGQIFRLVSHLIYWGKATAIYPLCETNVYVITPNTNMIVNSSLVEKFVDLFPGMSLPAVISEFSLPTPLGEHRDVLGLPHLQAQQIKMVVWMLQHHLIVQLHTYIYLVPATKSESCITAPQGLSNKELSSTSENMSNGEAQDTKSPSRDETSETKDHSSLGPQNLFHGKYLTAEEQQCILNVPAASNPEDLQLFLNLCPYFDGRHHLEETMYYKNIQRSQLLTLLDKFRDVLVMCQHEDIGITTWLHDDT